MSLISRARGPARSMLVPRVMLNLVAQMVAQALLVLGGVGIVIVLSPRSPTDGASTLGA